MPFIRKAEFNRLQRAGNAMSNVCYNLAQTHLPQAEWPRVQKTMQDAQTEWDAAKEAVRQSWIAKEAAHA